MIIDTRLVSSKGLNEQCNIICLVFDNDAEKQQLIDSLKAMPPKEGKRIFSFVDGVATDEDIKAAFEAVKSKYIV
jgi:hypothetical protein